MMAAPHVHRHEDRGASLILAIGFVLMVSAIVGGLAALITSGINNRSTLQTVRDRQYAADAGIQDAITTVRAITDRSGNYACDPSSVGTYVPYISGLNSISIRVDCVKAYAVTASGVTGSSTDNYVLAQRNIIFNACVNTGSACLDANVIVRAQVNFEQLYGVGVTKTFVQSWSVNG